MAYHSFLVEPISCHAWNKDRTRECQLGAPPHPVGSLRPIHGPPLGPCAKGGAGGKGKSWGGGWGAWSVPARPCCRRWCMWWRE